MSNEASLPRIVSLSGEDRQTVGGRIVAPFRVVSPIVQFGAKLSDLSDRQYMSEGHCLMYLHRRVANVRNAKSRGRHLLGRIYNALTGSADSYVTLTGPVFHTILKANGEAGLSDAQRKGDYAVRLDVAEEMLARFTDVMKGKGALR